jgi:hypothetical protein
MLIFASAFAIALVAVFAVATSFRTSKTIEQSAAQHGIQESSGTATNKLQPIRTDTVR